VGKSSKFRHLSLKVFSFISWSFVQVLSWSFFGCNRLRILLTLLSFVGVSRLSRNVFPGAIALFLSITLAWKRLLFLDSKFGLDIVIILNNLIFESSNNLFLPSWFPWFNLFFELLVSLGFTVTLDSNQLLFKISKWKDCKLNVEVVEDIWVISLQWNSIWTNENWENTVNLLGFFIFFIINSFNLCCLSFTIIVPLFSSTLWINISSSCLCF
jgi:hypothetical protein